jgi:dCTP deaminase
MNTAHAAGILPCQSLQGLIDSGAMTSETAFDHDQVQPASVDLRLGARVWRVRASFLPRRGGA